MRIPRTALLRAALVLVTLGLGACGPSAEEQAAARADAIEVVEGFGTRLKHVNLLAERQQLSNSIRDTYGPYVTTLLLGGWLSDPASAPGREASSPWPDRIEVRDATPVGSDGFDVAGDIVYVTSVEGDVALKQPFTARVVRGPDDVWRISEYDE